MVGPGSAGLDVTARRPQGEEIAVLATQMREVIKDVEGLRKELERHRLEHVSGRRWAVGLAMSGLATIGGLYGWVALLIHH